MKILVKSVFAMLCLMLMVAFVPAFGITAYAKTYSGGEYVEVTNLHVNDVLESGVTLHCPDTHALGLYVDSIRNYATNPYTTTERYWVEREISHNDTTYTLQVSTYFPNADGVTLDKSNIQLTVGDTSPLTATVTPEKANNKAVTWSSSDDSIATVAANGVVTAVAEGTATITVTTVDGGFTATCSVTVTPPVAGVTLAPAELSMKVGDEPKTLTATVTPANASDKTVTWSSSNESVATVDQNGNVTAVGKGTAIITCTTNDGGFTADCTVTVTLPVTGVTLDPTELSMKVGDTPKTLTATVSPDNAGDKTIIWSSSDDTVAKVENGVVQAIAKGTAVITVTTNDGGFTATCNVTVTQPVKKVSLTPTTIFMTVGNAPQTLTATVDPDNASNKTVTWSSSNDTVATVDQYGKVTAVGTGTAVITVITEDGSFTASCTVNVIDPSTATLMVIKGDKQNYKNQAVQFTFRFIEDTADKYDYKSDFKEATLKGDNFPERVLVDGEYKAENGSLLLSIENSLLKELKPGTYTLTVSLISGKSASATFTVPGGIDTPNTGDNTSISSLVFAWILFLLSLLLIVYEADIFRFLHTKMLAVPAGMAALFRDRTNISAMEAETNETEAVETKMETN